MTEKSKNTYALTEEATDALNYLAKTLGAKKSHVVDVALTRLLDEFSKNNIAFKCVTKNLPLTIV